MTAQPEPSHEPRRRAPSLRRKLAYSALAALLALPTGEAALRIFDIERLPYTNPALYQQDEELTYVMRPDVRVYSHGTWVETNRHGLRGADWDEAHAAGKRCVMFLGHSIAFGFGLAAEQSFVHQFSELNDRGLVGINLGHCGYRYHQEFGIANRLVDEIRPVATVVLFTGNDFDDVYDVFSPAVHGEEQAGALHIPGKQWLRRNSVLYAFLRKRYNALLVSLGIRHEPAWGHRILRGDTQENLSHYAAYEANLRALMQRTGAPVVLAAFPNGIPQAALERVRSIAQDAGAHWLDFSGLWLDEHDYLRNNALRWDTHPNASTHRTMAKMITEAVSHVLANSPEPAPLDG